LNKHNPDHHIEKCIAMFEKLSEYIDNELDDLTCQDIENHARDCIKCHTCLETLKRTIDLCRNMKNKPVPEQYSHKLREFIQNLA